LHLLTINIIPAILVYFLALAFVEFRNRKVFLNRYAIYILITAVLSVALFIFYPNISSLLKSFLTLDNHFSYFGKVLNDYASVILTPIITIAGIIYLWKKKRKECVFISSLFFTALLMAVFFWNRNAGEQYIFFAKPFQIILLASGIYFTAEFVGKNFKRYGKKVRWASLLILLLLLPNYAYFFQENNAYHQNSNSELPNYRKVFNYFLKKRGADDILITRNFRNYYFAGANVNIATFGGERSAKESRRLTEERLKKIRRENSCGWLIWSENDENFISKDAREYISKELPRVSDSKVRGKITVNRWCDE